MTLLPLDNLHQNIGMGMIGELANPMTEQDFLNFVKQQFNLQCIKHSKLLDKPIKKVALLGGSGSFAIDTAKHLGADIYISSDFKYHDFFKAENQANLGRYWAL